ncbi:AAA family ATPase [Natronobacterium gregoryi]|uniref:DNA repair and recombination protein RadB n=2 Tax=Natronobacterium gregoryi TaxID=44930 RepID=L0AM31_NATGS|nr:AAA family ATPase [Natronobacterium gregoryi]AFZ74856.1 RecA/RadA recombinase [Natronobacterium gregoryi SP2]ELY73274.1 DNA repair and recombination protein RadB [Natronobacterium gregoryi SP2]PLK19310.1 DNA repair protein RadB [Natronobacterium gregoryi SP2]SFJ53898.1 DNA repair protein RadB [Natronobacterium gregoryi]
MNDEAIPTGCEPVDDLLGGGFERGTVTQLYGTPAAGKTNLALSAAVETAAAGGTVVYIDTEGVSVDRFEQLLSARVAADGDPSLEKKRGDGGDEPSAEEENDEKLGVETTASRIVVEDAVDFEEQAEAVRDAEAFAERADLIVLDSATGFYRLERTDDGDEGEALRQVARQVTHLLSLARKHDLAVVLTNQVFADPDADRTRALGGNTLEHWTGIVVRLERFRGGNRRATLEKHRSKPAGESVQFRITDSGLEGSEESQRF